MTSPRRASNQTRTRKRKRKRKKKKRNQHLDQQNVHPAHNPADLHSAKPPLRAEAAKDPITLNMEKQEQHLQDQELHSSLSVPLGPEVLRQKPDQGVIHLMDVLLRLNHEMVGVCHLLVGMLVHLEHFHRVEKEVQYINISISINHNIIDLLVVLHTGRGRRQLHPHNLVPLQIPIHQNENPHLPLLPIPNPARRRRNHQPPMSHLSRIRSCKPR